MILLDSDHLSVLIDRRCRQHPQLVERLTTCGDPLVSTTVVCAEEQCRGWLAVINRTREVRGQVPAYLRLAELFEFLGNWELARFDERAADQFRKLRSARIRIGTQDLKIASIALVHDALLLSANLRDFRQIAGLNVEDWLLGVK